MKKVALLFATVCLWGFAQAQESVFKFSGTDAPFGKYELSYERTFNEGMNNIKSSGKMRKQGKWPNIMTKGSFQFSFAYITKKHTQTFGNGMTAVLDTNSNHEFGNVIGGLQVKDDAAIHSVSRNTVSTVSGIAFEAEYRSYIKTYRQTTGDAPRGWYIAPFFRFQTTTLDFDDNTAQENNWAMNRLMYGDIDVFNGHIGPWEGDEATGSPIAWSNPNATNALVQAYDLRWHDVSFKQSESVIVGGLAIGRQWLISDKFSIDVQIGPQYKIVTRGERVFNGNDTWNLNQQEDNVNLLANDPNFYFFNKFGDVYDFHGDGADNDVANNYFGVVDEDGTTVVINGKGDAEALGYMTGFNRDLPGLTDFGKLDTYRLKVRVGYAF